MISNAATLPDTPDELKEIVTNLHAKVEHYDRENELLREYVRLSSYFPVFVGRAKKFNET